MRKMILLNVWACAIAGTAFAQDFYFTEADNGKGGLTISATDGVSSGNLANISTKTVANAVLDNIELNFDITDSGTYTMTGAAKFGSNGNYSLNANGTSTINFLDGSTASLNANQGIIAGSYESKFILNVQSEYAGTISANAIVAQNRGTLILNLEKKNAFQSVDGSSSPVRLFLYARSALQLNMSADQTFCFDFRSGNSYNANKHIQFGITNGARLFVTETGGAFAEWANDLEIVLNGGLNGGIYFLESIVTSDGFKDGTITINQAGNDQKLTIVDTDRNKLGNDSGLFFGKATLADGNTYYYVSSTQVIPEPATWAAIFGAFALALVVYRRRR